MFFQSLRKSINQLWWQLFQKLRIIIITECLKISFMSFHHFHIIYSHSTYCSESWWSDAWRTLNFFLVAFYLSHSDHDLTIEFFFFILKLLVLLISSNWHCFINPLNDSLKSWNIADVSINCMKFTFKNLSWLNISWMTVKYLHMWFLLNCSKMMLLRS